MPAVNPKLLIKRGSGSPISLTTGELAMDLQNSSLFIGTANGPLAIAGEHVFAKKTFVNDAVAAEASLRSSADSTLTSNLNSEISRATAAEGVIAANLATEISDRAAAVSAEASARSAADTVLDGKIAAEKTRVDAILSAADADKDSFAEIVTLINSVDTTNDQAFAGYVTSNNAALASETSARTAADTALGGRIDSAEGVSSALDTRVTAAEADIVTNATAISTEVTNRTNADTALGLRIDGVESDATALAARVTEAESNYLLLDSNILAEEGARNAAVSAEASSRASSDTTLQGNIDAEASTRATADTSLSNRLDSLEAVSSDSRLDDLEADVANHETRITALETTIDGGVY